MPWCPVCQLEYMEGKKICSDCNKRLADDKIPDPIVEYVEGEFLYSAADEMEAVIIESLLRSEGIQTMRKYREAGDFLVVYMGTSSFGIDIHVPEEQLERAQEIIDGRPIASNNDEDENEALQLEAFTNEHSTNTKRSLAMRYVLIVLIIIYFLL